MVYSGINVMTGKSCEIEIKSNKISAIRELNNSGGAFIGPALFDIQINGFAGRDFNDPAKANPDEVEGCVASVRKSGTGFLFPTLITNSSKEMLKGIEVIGNSLDRAICRESILGLHLEGPYISSEDGPRGAHEEAYARDPDFGEFRELLDASKGMLKMITLAPERKGAIEFISKVAETGVRVSLGHHCADRETIQKAIEAGASICTHLGNGAHSMLHRWDSYIWPQIADDRIYGMFISDGHHLPADMLKSFVRTKGLEKSIITSDAVQLAGMPPGVYDFFNRKVEKLESGKIVLIGTPNLAGSSSTTLECVLHCANACDISLADAFHLATRNPAKLFGFEDRIGSLKVGDPANLVVYHKDKKGRPVVEKVVLDGKELQ